MFLAVLPANLFAIKVSPRIHIGEKQVAVAHLCQIAVPASDSSVLQSTEAGSVTPSKQLHWIAYVDIHPSISNDAEPVYQSSSSVGII